MVLKMTKIDREWSVNSSIDCNEYFKLKLPRTWEPLDSLRTSAKDKKSNIVFLMETKLHAIKMEKVRIQLGFEHMFAVGCVDKGGGLALFWMTDSGVEIQNYCHRHINANVCPSPTNLQWKLTYFYGHLDPSKGPKAWSLL
jgi:hypothetical protein